MAEVTGLVIKEPWIDLILAGQKTWEIRGTYTKQRGKIALIKSKSGRIYGTCDIVDCVGPLSLDDLRANEPKHRVPPERQSIIEYPKIYAWVVANPKRFPDPI